MIKSNLTAICSALVITLFIFTGPAFGDDALYVDEDGNVGIGTTIPAYQLDVNSGGSNAVANFVSTDNRAYIIIRDDDTISTLGSEGGHFFISPDGVLSSAHLAANISTGNVGIGTTSPSYKLHVNESSGNIAIYGLNSTASTSNYGIYGCVSGAGTNNYGVRGLASSTGINNVGVYGSSSGAGTSGRGVYGYSYGAGTINYGVFGRAVNATTNWAGYFDGDVDVNGDLTADSYNDHTPYYEGDALSEIAKISGKDGEIDHSTLPDFTHVTQKVPVFEESELTEISPDDAFETVMVEQAKLVETTNDKGNIVKSKIKKGVKTESRGYKVEDGKIVEIFEETPLYETELIETTQLRNDVYFDGRTGKVYQMQGDGEVFEKDGRIYQRNQTGIEIEDQRDLGAMISMLTVAIQQQQKEIEELKSMLQERK